MTGWQCHQLDHMQIICTLFQTDNHASTSPPVRKCLKHTFARIPPEYRLSIQLGSKTIIMWASVLCQENAREERLQNDLLCVQWDAKTLTQTQNNNELEKPGEWKWKQLPGAPQSQQCWLPGSCRTCCRMVRLSSFTPWLYGLNSAPDVSPNAFINTCSLALFNTEIHLDHNELTSHSTQNSSLQGRAWRSTEQTKALFSVAYQNLTGRVW